MTIGGSIALILIGAILAFAVEFDLAGISITAVGYILMIGGLIGLVLGFTLGQRRSASVTRSTTERPATDRTVVEERERP